MELHSLLVTLLVGILYPLWLMAGFVDYLCHRRTRIESTSGTRESLLHVAQFAILGVALLLATCLVMTPLPFAAIVTAVVVHTALSYIDVSYTESRRRISPLEQHAHGFLDVLPIVVVCLLAILYWESLRSHRWMAIIPTELSPTAWLAVGSYFVLAGVPVFEELARTLRDATRR
jgi:hypothetical protein